MSSHVPTIKDLGREPIELVEIIVPKCVNTYGSAPCTAAGSAGGECFNTRATCQDHANYQARPLAHLTPDRILNQGDTGTTAFNGLALYIVEADLYIPPDPDGVVFEAGGSGQGLYIGFTAGELVVRAGDGATATPTGSARFAINSAAYEGKNYTLIARFDYDSGVDCTVTLYLFDPVELELSLIGAASSSTDPTTLFDTGGYGVGVVNGTAPTGESVEDYTGTIDSLRMYDNQTATLFPDANAYRTRYFFDDGRKARVSDPIYILPLLLHASAVGSRINVAGSDERYEPLGRRAFFECSIADAPHSDYPYDPYRTTRLYDPLQRGTFWMKWLAREKFGRTKSLVRRYTGYNGDALAAMRRQTYVLDRVARGQNSVSVSCRDVLSLTEFRRAQVPAPTAGVVDVLLTDVATTLFLAGDVTTEYPTTGGTIIINDEIMTYAAATYDGVDDQTDFTGLVRGTDGSTAAEHAVEDTVQLCRRYTAASVSEILLDLLLVDARLQGQLVDVAKILSEDTLNLSAYSLTTVIHEPTGIDQLIGELAESCAFYIWWNERSQKVDMQAIQPTDTVAAEWTDEANVIMDAISVEERPKERISTLSLYFNPRNFAGDYRDPTNYRNQLIVANSNNNDLDQYAVLPQLREVFSRWLINNAQTNQTASRYVNRYVDIPIYSTITLDAKDAALWLGDFVSFSTEDILDSFGEREVRRFVIIEAEEVEAGHKQRVVLSDVTLDGRVYRITVDGQGNYTAVDFAAGLAFITDNDGFNSDGTRGATIA